MKRILIYLFHTRTLGLVYKASGSLLAYSDSDFANDESTRTSRSGSLVLLAGAPIHWRSQKQRLVTLSTSEAEYIAFSETTRELLHLRNLLTELGRNNTPTVYCDNQSTIKMLTGEAKGTRRTKHIDIKFRFVEQTISDNRINVEYLCTEEMLADILTKPLPKKRFEYLRSFIVV